MSVTTSLAFPNMINVAGNRVSVKQGNDSILNRTKLLLLTDPTEMYNNPQIGVGVKRYLWQYNTPNVVAMLKDRITQQLRDYEPCVIADRTQYTVLDPEVGELLNLNKLQMTVGLVTTYEDTITVEVNNA